jgi:hypothetical protein
MELVEPVEARRYFLLSQQQVVVKGELEPVTVPLEDQEAVEVMVLAAAWADQEIHHLLLLVKVHRAAAELKLVNMVVAVVAVAALLG